MFLTLNTFSLLGKYLNKQVQEIKSYLTHVFRLMVTLFPCFSTVSSEEKYCVLGQSVFPKVDRRHRNRKGPKTKYTLQ